MTKYIALSIDKKILSLYGETGDILTIPQDHVNFRKILELAQKGIQDNGFVTIDARYLANPPPYNNFLKGTFLRFVSTTYDKLVNILSKPIPEELTVGNIPKKVSKITQEEHIERIVQEAEKEQHTDSLTAIVTNSSGSITPIEDVSQIKNLIDHSVNNKSIPHLEAFMIKVADLATKRKHTVKDLLDFMEKGNMPLDKEGNIIAYKLLNKRNGYYVDNHSGNVKQKVGSIVKINEDLVDDDRSIECSSGLHIARQDYLNSFGGNALVLIRFNPLDVIAVSHKDPRKIRVSSYEILDEIPFNLKQAVVDSSFDKIETGRELLNKAINCLYPSPVEEVFITQHQGRGLKITPLVQEPKQEEVPAEEQILPSLVTPEDKKEKDVVTVNPIDVATANQQNLTLAEQFQKLFKEFIDAKGAEKEALYHRIILQKKKQKKSLSSLGILSKDIKKFNKYQEKQHGKINKRTV